MKSKEYMKKYNDKHKSEHKKYYLNRRDSKEYQKQIKKYQKEHRKELKEYMSKYQKAYRKLNKIKVNARNMAGKYIPIPKGEICFKCKKKLATQRHHEDYSKPLIIKFICKKCHNLLRRLNNG